MTQLFSKIKFVWGDLSISIKLFIFLWKFLHLLRFCHVSRKSSQWLGHGSPWASCQIRKIAGCACAGNAGNVFPRRRFQRKPLVSDPGMHHGTCVTHVPWCMSGSLNCGDGENVPGIPGACAPAILLIWKEAHRLRLFAEFLLRLQHSRLTATRRTTKAHQWRVVGMS